MTSDTRHKMLVGTVRLLAERGLQETSFSQVLELTGAPRGSIYHHFPKGKDELIASAIDLSGSRAIKFMDQVKDSSADLVTEHFINLWREVLTRSKLRAGCSVLAVTVATDSTDLLGHASAVFTTWRGCLSTLMASGGLSKHEADGFATTLIAAMEGAVVMSRAEQSMESFELVAERMMFDVNALMSR